MKNRNKDCTSHSSNGDGGGEYSDDTSSESDVGTADEESFEKQQNCHRQSPSDSMSLSSPSPLPLPLPLSLPLSPSLFTNENDGSCSYSNAIQFLQNVIDLSIPDPFLTDDVHYNYVHPDSSSGKQQERCQSTYIIPFLSPSQSPSPLLVPKPSKSKTNNCSETTSSNSSSSSSSDIDGVSSPSSLFTMKILESIEIVISHTLHPPYQHRRHQQEKGGETHDDADADAKANENKSENEKIIPLALIRQIFNLLLHTIGNQNTQLFTFIHDTILRKHLLLPIPSLLLSSPPLSTTTTTTTLKSVERIGSSTNSSTNSSSNSNEVDKVLRGEGKDTEKNLNVNVDLNCYEELIQLVFEIIPFVIPCDLNSDVELQFLNSLLRCVFPHTFQIKALGKSQTGEKEKESNVQQEGEREENNETEGIGINTNMDMNISMNINHNSLSSASLSRHLPSSGTMYSMIQLFQKHIFQNKQFVLFIIVEHILPQATTHSSSESMTTTLSTPESMKLIFKVIFLYLSHEEQSDRGDDVQGGKKKKKENKSINVTTSKDNNGGSKNTAHILQIIRNIFLQQKERKYQLQQQNHIGDPRKYSDFETDVAKIFISFIKKSQSLAEGYKTIITNTFLQKNDIQTGTRMMNDADKMKKNNNTCSQDATGSSSHAANLGWIRIDLYALLIIYHCHPVHRTDMKKIIEDLCYQKKFPFHEIQEMLPRMSSEDKRAFVDETSSGCNNTAKLKKSTAVTSAFISENRIIASAIVDVGLYLLLTPIRNPDYPRDENAHFFSSQMRNFDRNDSQKSLIHPTTQILLNTKSLIEKVYFFMSSMQTKQEDLINSLLYLSSNTTFIPKVVKSAMNGKLFDDKHFCTEGRRNRQLNNNMPYDLDSFITPKSQIMKSKVEIRNIYDVSMQALSTLCAIFSASSPRNGFNRTKMRSIIIGRIHNFVSSSSLLHWDNLPSEKNYDMKTSCAIIRDEIEMLNFTLFDKYSSLLVTLSCQNTNYDENSNNFDEVKRLFQKLLFASANTCKISTSMIKCHGYKYETRVLGIILGKNLIGSPNINENDQSVIFESVVNILVPSTDTNPACPHPKLEPIIGYWGLRFLTTLSTEVGGSKGGKVCQYPVSVIFKYVKAMVSHTGIVQLESDVLSRQQQNVKDRTSVLAYQSPPSCFYTVTKQKRKMVYCISTFLDKNVETAMEISDDLGGETIQLMRYINALIDIYLNMGRCMNPKWSPDPWLSASIELFGSSDDPCGPELLSHLSVGSDEGEDCLELPLKRTISFIVSIGLLRAVLINAHEHYSHNLSIPLSTRHRGWNLMQLVLAKIYDLQKQYQKCLHFYNDRVKCDVESMSAPLSVYHDLISIKLYIFEKMPSVPLYVLWTCVKETFSRWTTNHFQERNISVREFLSTLDSTSRENLACQLWLKQLILQEMGGHSQMILQSVEQMRSASLNPEDTDDGSSILDEEGLKAILQVTLDLVTWLQPFNEFNEIQEETCAISVRVLLDQIKHFLHESFDFLQFIVEKITFLARPYDLAWLVSGIYEDHRVENSLGHMCTKMTEITFQIDDPFLSSKILDFVSLLSTHCNISVKGVSTANWNHFISIKSKFLSNEERLVQIPHSLAFLLYQHLAKSNDRDPSSINKSAVLLNLFRSISHSSSENYEDVILRHHLMAHWAHESSLGSSFSEEYHILIQSLRKLTYQLTSSINVDTKSGAEDDDYRTTPIRSLGVQTIPMAYELMLNMSLASFVLNMSEDGDGDPSSEEVGRLADFLKVFTSVIDLYTLYTSNLNLFSERMFDTTIRASSLMIKSCEIRIQKSLMKWKPAKSEATPRRANRRKLAVRSQEPFFDNVQKFAQLILDLCNLIPDSGVDDEVNETSLTNRKAIISLESRCEGMLSSLHEIDGEYNYFLPSSLECLEVSGGNVSRGLNNKHDNDSKKDDSPDQNRPKFEGGKNSSSKRKRNSSSKKNDSQELPNDLKDDDDGDSDSFGVVGDW